jgi:ribonuclease BN (tRNA processing enzyme)
LTPQSQPQKIVQSDGLVITAISGHHRDAPSIIYRVDFGGKSVTFTCDIDSAGHDNLRRIARDTDLLVFHCVVLDPPGSPSVLYTLHTAPKDLGMIADQDKAKQLMLGHLHPTIDEAQDAVLTSVSNGYKGSVTLAKDGLRIVP